MMLPKETMIEPDLEDLAEAAQKGDLAAADRLCEVAQVRLTRLALAFGVPPDEVPDLVQEVLEAGWRNLLLFDRGRGSFIAWLVPGLRGRMRNRLRAASRFQRCKERFEQQLQRHTRWRREQESAEARLLLARLLRGLTARQREVVALYELEELSAREVAGLLGLSEAGVRSIARDARKRLLQEAQRLEGDQRGVVVAASGVRRKSVAG